MIIPQFILQELHHIADSNDPLKKIRGRRGLDVIEKIQKQKDHEVIILDQNPTKDNVDAKLVDLALELNGTIITNDFNLNKVAELRGVKCLNLNKLANALKPAVLSGEVLTVQIIREGKTQGQGIAYMDDGTMVVVENARQAYRTDDRGDRDQCLANRYRPDDFYRDQEWVKKPLLVAG